MNLRAQPRPSQPPPLRRVRMTLPPKASLGGLRVDAVGQVSEGEEGYYWYGEGIVLATAGPLYLVGGASVPHPAVVALAALVDARRWRAERGEFLPPPPEDWAGRALALSCLDSALVAHATGKLGEPAWTIYCAALETAVRMLALR